MGHFLKPKPTTRAGAKLRYERAVARAEEQYARAVAEISRREQEAEEKPASLSVRTLNCLINANLIPFTYPKKPSADLVDPESLAKLGADRLIKIPNFGHKCLAEVDAWLRERGYQLNS